MLTGVTIRNFKRFGSVEIELGSPVVFIGPNNSGKTSALQALALWSIGLRRWNEKRAGTSVPEKRPGVTVNRRDLVAIPIPVANLLWRGLRTRNTFKSGGKQRTENVRIEITVTGIGPNGEWRCGLEFDYANEESFYCRPLRTTAGATPERMEVPDEAADVEIAYLPPMSGLAAAETRLDPGAIDVRIGEGRTAEVLRNLCYRVYEDDRRRWRKLTEQIERLFGAELEPPRYVAARGEVTMRYREGSVSLDLSSAGRGLQQTLLILAYMHSNDGAVLMLDEPDAHLEILRQRQIYQLITDAAQDTGSQIIAASHSEVLLNEAAGKHSVIAFVGEPHRIDDRGNQLLKSLRDIGFEQYAQAEVAGWVLYVEGSTDLAILRAFARRLGHDRALAALDRPFVHYVGNQITNAERHFYGLREALPDLRGVALLDDLPSGHKGDRLRSFEWKRREIENYLCTPATLQAYAEVTGRAASVGPLFETIEVDRRSEAMSEAVSEIETAMRALDLGSPWNPEAKVSDDFLGPVFKAYFNKLGLPNLMLKRSFYELAEHVPDDEMDQEITDKLNAIASVAEAVHPVTAC